jgi:predicted transcriptional regulator
VDFLSSTSASACGAVSLHVYLQSVGDPEPATTLATALEREINSRKLTQERAAKTLGVSQQQVSRWLSGARPNDESHASIAEFLGCTADDLSSMLPTRRRTSTTDALTSSTTDVQNSRPSEHQGFQSPSSPGLNKKQEQQEIFARIFLERWAKESLPDEVVIAMVRYLKMDEDD